MISQSPQSELSMKDVFMRQYGTVVFLELLKVNNMPSTVMSYYSTVDREELFPTPASDATAVVNT